MEDGDDLGRLSVSSITSFDETVRALEAADVGAAHGPDTVALRIDELRRRIDPAVRGDGWEARWDAMIAYAQRSGWVTDDDTGVVAHVIVDDLGGTP